MYVFTTYITLKNGRRLYAREVGLRAFRIEVKDEPWREDTTGD